MTCQAAKANIEYAHVVFVQKTVVSLCLRRCQVLSCFEETDSVESAQHKQCQYLLVCFGQLRLLHTYPNNEFYFSCLTQI